MTQRHVEVLSHIDGEHVIVKRMGSIGGRSVGGAGQRMSDCGTVGAGGGEECAEDAEESTAGDVRGSHVALFLNAEHRWKG